MGRHGGGAFSGKDPSKVDRSAAYAARWVAKNLVAAKIARRCEVQLAYAIGVAEPVSIRVETFGTGESDMGKLEKLVRRHFDLTPKGIEAALSLRRPIYRATSYHGHFGRESEGFPWENKDRAETPGNPPLSFAQLDGFLVGGFDRLDESGRHRCPLQHLQPLGGGPAGRHHHVL